MPAREKNRDAPARTPRAILVRADTANMYQATVGAEGIAPADMEALTPALREAHAVLVSRSRGGLDAEYACLELPQHMRTALAAIREAAATLRSFRDVLVVGIGGSSLGAKAVHRALNPAPAANGPSLHFLENIDPYFLDSLLARLVPETTALIGISKSGGTIETVVQYLIARDWLEQRLGRTQAASQQWLVTDPDKGWMRELARREGIAVLPVPPRVGGRFSVLSAVGLLPLAVAGVDIDRLLQGAADNAARCRTADNPALELAALYYLLDVRRGKRVSIMMPYINPLRLFVDWYCQLWAESLGKHRVDQPPAGTLPVRAMGAVDQHSQLQMYLESRLDKMFTFIALTRWEHDRPIPLGAFEHECFPYLEGRHLSDVIQAEFLATREVITHAGHPNLTLELAALDAHTLGQLIDLYQRITIYAGLLYGVNPLDQPAVEVGKQLALTRLSTRA
jgi:glucose-6-phosphate isomerase